MEELVFLFSNSNLIADNVFDVYGANFNNLSGLRNR